MGSLGRYAQRRKLYTLSMLAVALVFAAMIAVSAQGSSTVSASVQLGTSQTLASRDASKISAGVLQDTANGKSASILVLMSDQANLSAAYGMKDQDARGWFVYNTLRAHADRTQAAIRAFLQARGIGYTSYWISNALNLTADRALVEALAARSDVSKIEANRPFKAIDPIRNSTILPSRPLTVEWGVQNVKAPDVWALGYTGQGIVIGNADTGMRWTHQAIKGNYKGWNGVSANHNYNWWDGVRTPSPGNPCGLTASSEPCDDDELLGGGHGTHTTGTTSGDDGQGNKIGVAPGATWIGCRNLDRGVGYPITYLSCFQFFLAPHDLSGNNPNPALRPHVENNSWTCVEGCAGDILKPAVENSQAAGIFIEASAGNDGPTCSTIAFEPQIFEATFDTGAIDINNALASFSSRGPVVRDGSLRLKPNVSAPGVNVRSALRGSDTEYGDLSGTSMAGPHTVGVVALLWSARPELTRQITETKLLLQQSANPQVAVPDRQTPDCGGTPPEQIPNNYFGWGRIDALAAVTSGCSLSSDYSYTLSTGATMAPANTLVPGSTCNGCVVTITLPFTYQFYGTPYNSVNASSRGNLQFISNSSAPDGNQCVPAPQLNDAIMAYWDDLNTNINDTMGIYTSTSGTAPNRTFNIRWSAGYIANDARSNFEVVLYEGQPKFDIIYGQVTRQGFSATIGVQKGTGERSTLYSCGTTPGVQQGQKIIFDQRVCTLVGPPIK